MSTTAVIPRFLALMSPENRVSATLPGRTPAARRPVPACVSCLAGTMGWSPALFDPESAGWECHAHDLARGPGGPCGTPPLLSGPLLYQKGRGRVRWRFSASVVHGSRLTRGPGWARGRRERRAERSPGPPVRPSRQEAHIRALPGTAAARLHPRPLASRSRDPPGHRPSVRTRKGDGGEAGPRAGKGRGTGSTATHDAFGAQKMEE